MGYRQEWVDDFDEASEFDLVDSVEEDSGEVDPEAYAPGEAEGAIPEEADAADALEQTREVPEDEDEPREP